MIVPLQKTSVILPASDRMAAVEAMQSLGVMHVETLSLSESAERSALESRFSEVVRCAGILEVLPHKGAASEDKRSGEELFLAAQQLLAEQSKLQRESEQYTQYQTELAPWGEFRQDMMSAMKQQGVYCTLCQSTNAEWKALCAAGFVCREVAGSGAKLRRFAVIADHETTAEEALPAVRFSTTLTLSEVEAKLAEIRAAQDANRAQLTELAKQLPAIQRYRDAVAAALEVATVRDSQGECGIVTTLTGYVPEPEMPKISRMAAEHGWGLFYRPADPKEEAVPTLVKQSKVSRLVNPLMNFLAISPGYDERDVSLPVLVFFTIFFGMLVGDAGYGVLFLAISGGVFIAKRKVASMRVPLAFFMLLSVSAIIWGALTGNWFGAEGIPGVKWLTDGKVKDRNVQLICFSLALIQLALARLWRLASGWGDWREMLTHLGWTLVLTGNFLLVLRLLLFQEMPMMPMLCFYGVGIAMAAAGEVDFTDVGSMFGFPFSVVSSFVDVLSYIRLFAVGLAGYYLAACFNDMARPMFDTPYLIPVGVAVLLAGHVLNIALASMSVLVHGVRLNTLEFSSHLGLRWAGFAFRPFRKQELEANKLSK